jgi:undecaprenyl-diphosphatase
VNESIPAWLGLAMGAVQGVSEFLPISSDGHLAAFGLLFSLDLSLEVVVLLHAATLVATMLVFRRDLLWLLAAVRLRLASPRTLYETTEGKLLAAIAVACVPTGIIGLTLESRLETLSATPWIVGAGFLGSAFAVFSTRGRSGTREVPSLREAIVIGIVQGIAVLPGVSRSALTIASAMGFGLSGPAAFRFSFLLSMPVIAGATLLELGDPEVLASIDRLAWLGALSAFATGCAALLLLRRVLQRGHFWLFTFYLVPLAGSMMLLELARS